MTDIGLLTLSDRFLKSIIDEMWFVSGVLLDTQTGGNYSRFYLVPWTRRWERFDITSWSYGRTPPVVSDSSFDPE